MVLYRYLPFGINGMLGGAATLFFAYIGFDTVASTAEEVCTGFPQLHTRFHISTFCR